MGLNKLNKDTLVELVTLLAIQKKTLEINLNYKDLTEGESESLDSRQERIAQIEISNGINLDEL